MTRDSRIFASGVSGSFERVDPSGQSVTRRPISFQVRALAMCAGALFLTAGFAARALANQVVYTNGPINGTIDGFTITGGLEVADSFTLSQTATLTSVTFGVEQNLPGEITTSVGWAILSTDPFPGSSPTLTTAAVSSIPNSPPTTTLFGIPHDLNLDSFSLPGITLGPGTYFLVLGNATALNSFFGNDLVDWDQNNGPSVAFNNFGPLTGDCITVGVPACGSEAFTIFGTTPTTVPEPGTPLLLGTALLGIRALRRRAQL